MHEIVETDAVELPELSPVPDWYDAVVKNTVLHLAAHLPLEADLIVTFDAPAGYWGLTGWDEERGVFTIELSLGITSAALLQEVVMHEYAHAMAWDFVTAHLSFHNPAWGVAYAECFRVIIEGEGCLQVGPFIFR